MGCGPCLSSLIPGRKGRASLRSLADQAFWSTPCFQVPALPHLSLFPTALSCRRPSPILLLEGYPKLPVHFISCLLYLSWDWLYWSHTRKNIEKEFRDVLEWLPVSMKSIWIIKAFFFKKHTVGELSGCKEDVFISVCYCSPYMSIWSLRKKTFIFYIVSFSFFLQCHGCSLRPQLGLYPFP